MGQVVGLPTGNVEIGWSSSGSGIGARVTDNTLSASHEMYEPSECLNNLTDASNEIDKPSEGPDESQDTSDQVEELSKDSDKQIEVSNMIHGTSTCLEESSKPQNESDEPSEGSDGVLVIDEPMNNITSSPEAVQQPEVIDMACIREYYHYAIE